VPFDLATGLGTNGQVSFAGNGKQTTYAYFNPAHYTLDVLAVPEPASWGMMIGGFGMIGAAARRRRARPIAA